MADCKPDTTVGRANGQHLPIEAANPRLLGSCGVAQVGA